MTTTKTTAKTAAKSRTRPGYTCRECGATAPRWLGRCPKCGEWDALVEDEPAPGAATGRQGHGAVPVALTDPVAAADEPMATGVGELDRALGGGLVPGSVTLLGGEPGCGKSTLAIQVAAGLAVTGRPCVVVSGEESVRQVQARAERVGAAVDGVTVVSETSLPFATAVVDDLAPAALVVDSVQTVTHPDVAGGAGSVTQVRECAQRLVELAKTRDLAVVLVGHVTKEGGLAGPRTLEHVVDTVVSIEGDRYHALRFVRVVKHRFGPTDQLGVLEMRPTGLADVADPSGLFLSDRRPHVPGSVVASVVDGGRPLVVEVQALLAKSPIPNARRSAQGVEAGRLAQILAVLDRRAGLDLSGFDVYVSAVGGLRVSEPGAHLGLALALAGAAVERATPAGLVALGEVGLAGEVRQVSLVERRLSEARRLGFSHALVPRRTPPIEGLELLRVATVGEAITAAGLT